MTIPRYQLAALLAALAWPASGLADVSVNAAKQFQTIQGFGSSERVFDDPHVFDNFNTATSRAATLLTPAQQNEVLDRLYGSLGLTWVRPATDANIEPANDNNDPEVTDLSKFNFAWKRNDAHADYVRRAKERGVKGYFLSPIIREPWMGVSSAKDVAEYAEWSMAMIRRWRALGVELPYFSLANEPGHSANTMSGPFMRDVIKKMGPKLRAEGFTLGFVISDDLNPSQAYNRCSVILADAEARQYVAAIASHLYDEPVHAMAQLRDLAAKYRLPLWMSEYSHGAMHGSALDFAERIIHPMLADYNVSVLMYMWGYFGQWSPPEYQLVTLTHHGESYTGYKLEKMYFVLGQFSRFVPPGAVRVDASSGNHSLQVTSFLNKGALTIVVINNTDHTHSETFRIRGLAGLTRIVPTRTSESENWVELKPIDISDSRFAATLAPRSVTTFVTGDPSAAANHPFPPAAKVSQLPASLPFD